MKKDQKLSRYRFIPKTYEYLYDENGKKVIVIADVLWFEDLMEKLLMCDCMTDEEE